MTRHMRLMSIPWLVAATLLMAIASVPVRATDSQALPPERANGHTIYMIGSTLMADYTTAIIDHLKKNTDLPPPIVSEGGSTRGVSVFCAGIGLNTPDIVAMSRRILTTELENCRDHGVTDIIEIQIGYDAAGIVSRRDDQDYPLTLVSMYHAIAAELPDTAGRFTPNRYQRWHDVDPSLPDTEIRFILPVPSLGGRAFLENRMLQSACRHIPAISTIFGAEDRVRQCVSLRTDNRIVELDTPYAQNVVTALATSPPGTLANLPLHFVLAHQEFLKVQPFDGVLPDHETVSNHQYGFIRPLYFLVKKAHIKNYLGRGLVVGLREFITEITRESTIGPSGYLVKMGLFPLDEKNRKQTRETSLRLDTTNR